ncbi:CaiB/BaiF CoA transferase family protein [Wukongibacter sp. M2B1]|uniref:CaiB/BaiF CoA transferase family protein n=1 Tax=Wukongibacter sp. M2B1 TaxID=3088895 RepID=UPI003D79BB05
MGVLEGIKVLDLTRVLAGPYCTMILGDMGAEIIKVERPKTGDDSRAFGPFINEESAYFMSINRNKKSITINLKKEKGKNILKELVKDSDIIVENFKPGTMEKLGLEYEALKEINPGIIYCAISGFGHTGPYSKRPAYDAVVQAMGGLMSITGQEDGRPTRVGSSIGDITAGLYGAIGILGALQRKNRTGMGEMVDVAMLDCQVSILENAIARYTVTGEIPSPKGNRHSSIVPFEPFPTKDGELMVAVGNDKLWAVFCKCIEREDLIDDYRFKTNPDRNKYYDELRPLLCKAMINRKTEEWQRILDDAGVPNGPINTVDKVLKDDHINQREMIVSVNHPKAGHVLTPGSPIKFRNNPNTIRKASPLIGEETIEILKENLNFSQKEIENLIEEGII